YGHQNRDEEMMAIPRQLGLCRRPEQGLNEAFLWGSTWQTYDGQEMQLRRRFHVRGSHRRDIMTIGKAIMAAAVLAIAAPATAAPAHDDDSGQPARVHRAHWRFHHEANEVHRRAHEEGFYSQAEHRALQDLPQDFHGDHAGTRHDHYTWRRWW